MGSKKRALVFYPMDFYEMSAGTHRRVFQVLTYLKERGFSTDLLSIDGYANSWSASHRAMADLCGRISVAEWKPGRLDSIRLKKAQVTGDLPDLAISPVRKSFEELLANDRYDFILVNYVYWASLAALVPDGTIKIIDLHDFATMYNYQISGEREFRLGRMFESEVRAISKFDYALSISEEETLILSQFCPGTAFIDMPVFYEDRAGRSCEKKYDLLFVGSDNPFNRKGVEWFMEKVRPLLPPGVKIAIVGKAGRFAGAENGVEAVEQADCLDGFYAGSKLAICPLKGGTGLKVKVIEALSYGMPVVTTSWGLRGILKKEDNGCIVADDERAFASAIMGLLRDEKLFDETRAYAMAFFGKKYSKDVCYNKLDGIFQRKAGQPCA